MREFERIGFQVLEDGEVFLILHYEKGGFSSEGGLILPQGKVSVKGKEVRFGRKVFKTKELIETNFSQEVLNEWLEGKENLQPLYFDRWYPRMAAIRCCHSWGVDPFLLEMIFEVLGAPTYVGASQYYVIFTGGGYTLILPRIQGE